MHRDRETGAQRWRHTHIDREADAETQRDGEADAVAQSVVSNYEESSTISRFEL